MSLESAASAADSREAVDCQLSVISYRLSVIGCQLFGIRDLVGLSAWLGLHATDNRGRINPRMPE